MVFINFEDERLLSDSFAFDLILEALREMIPSVDFDLCYFFFDEIQNIPDWEKFVRRLYEDHSKNIYLTGSNASFLSTEIATSLRGRSLAVEVLPLSFREFLRFQGKSVDAFAYQEKALLLNSFREYFSIGGFPELVNMEERLRVKVLQEYFNVMIHRDLVERFEISQANLLKNFIKKMFLGVGKPLSINKVYNDFKSNKYTVSKNTLYDFLGFAKDAYVIRSLTKFDYSEMKRENSDKKAFACDWGLLSAIDYAVSKDLGRLFENLVVLEFMKLLKPVFFYKQVNECDLIVETSPNELLPVQIAYDMSDADTRKRELKGLSEAAKSLEVSRGLILTMDQEEEIQKDNLQVKVIPAFKYFTMSTAQLDFLF